WPGSEPINEIEIEPLKRQEFRDFDPLAGYRFTTNSGSRILMRLPTDVKDEREFVLAVTDNIGREHRFWLGWFSEGGYVNWEIDLPPAEIQRIELKYRLMAVDYFWKKFPDVALKPAPAADMNQ